MELFGVSFIYSQYFWTTAAFVVLLAIMARMVVPAVNAVLDARAGKIAGDLHAAEAAKVEAARLLAEYQAQIAQARKEAGDVVSVARAEAEALASKRLAQVEAEIARKTDEARKALSAAEAEALRGIQAKVAELALHVAEKLVCEGMDAKLAGKITDNALKNSVN